MTILTAISNMPNILSGNETAMDITAHEAETDPGIARAEEIERMDLSIAHGHDPRKPIENQNTTDPADVDRSRLRHPRTQLHAIKHAKLKNTARHPQQTTPQASIALHPPSPPPPPILLPPSSAPHHLRPLPRSVPAAAAPSPRPQESTTISLATTILATISTRTPTARTTGTKHLKRYETGRNGNSKGPTG